jgi:hypothetical protein
MEYFKHDINASEDDKICELLATGGYELLGYYWRFVEYLYSRGGKVNKSKLKGVAWSLHMDVNKLLSLINDYTLFLQEDDIVYSKRILSEVEEFEAAGKRMSEIGKAGGKASAQARAKRTVDHAVNHTVENIEADAQACSQAEVEFFQADAQQNKIKENKENKINKRDSNIPPLSPEGESTHAPEKEIFGEFQNVKLTRKEYEKLKEDFPKKADDAIKFLDEYIEEKGYKSKSHNLAIRRWVIDAVDEHSKKEANSSVKQAFGFDFSLDDIFEKP